MVVSNIIDYIQIKINIVNPSQEPLTSSNAPNLNLKEIHVLCSFKVRHNLELELIKDRVPYTNQYHDAKTQSGASSIRHSPLFVLKGNGCSLHLQIQDREQKIRPGVYQRPVTISKSRSRYETPVRNL